MRRKLFVAIVMLGIGAAEASAQEVYWNCGGPSGLSILGEPGQAPIGANAWNDIQPGWEFPCYPVNPETEVWIDYMSQPPDCHVGWLYGNACYHINYYMFPNLTWAEAQANYNVVGWGRFTAQSKNYFIRYRDPYNGYWLGQPSRFETRDFGQPSNGGGAYDNPPDPSACNSDPWASECWDPIILNIGKEHKKFDSYKISSPEDGVVFDINADGVAERVAWPEKNSELAFLVFDRNGNGVIDDGSELFGNVTVPGARTGFFALQTLFNSNDDGAIDARDARFGDLLLWVDENRNGTSEPEELSAASTRLVGIGLGYIQTNYVDKNGNSFHYEGGAVMVEDKEKLKHKEHTHDAPRPVYDVFLQTRPVQ